MQSTSRFEATIPTQLHVLISDLRWRTQMLDADIQEEERRAGISDPNNLAYPMLAQNLRARRDNLQVSIAILGKPHRKAINRVAERRLTRIVPGRTRHRDGIYRRARAMGDSPVRAGQRAGTRVALLQRFPAV
ncbi:hypothetical protein ACVWZR_001269 [Bradyrhizobium sp. i1.3.1]